jgi:hypothetical protein
MKGLYIDKRCTPQAFLGRPDMFTSRITGNTLVIQLLLLQPRN